MKRLFFTLMPVLTGLAAAQILSACLVYSSNLHLYKNMTVLREAGWLTVPNVAVTETLKSFPPAFYGGLFFTFTIGIFLTAASLLIIKVIPALGSSRRVLFQGLVFCIWLGQLVSVNLNGINVWASLFILFIPPSAVWVSLKFSFPENRLPNRLLAGHLACLILLGVIGAYRLSPSVFSDFRDDVLLSSPAGLAVNDFYYRYTLFPAQAFKSLEQSQLRSVQISAQLSPALMRLFKRILIRYEYLPAAPSAKKVDIHIAGSWKRLIFSVNDSAVYEAEGEQFIKTPKAILNAVSRKADRWESFRQLTFLSLCVVSLLTVYFLLYLPFRVILTFFVKVYLSINVGRAGFRPRQNHDGDGTPSYRMGCSFLSNFFRIDVRWLSMLCGLAAGISLIWFWQPQQSVMNSADGIAEALKSESSQDRIAALKSIAKGKGRVGESAERISLSDSAVERYWLVRALERDRKTPAYSILIRLLDDPQINVAYRAVYALRERRERKAVPEILNRIKTSACWYFQLYAYKALRRLGWQQTASR